MNEADVTVYIEPVFRFCLKRLNNRYDAEDLASEIMVHVLNGLNKYKIDSPEGWVWRIAHNRYARFIKLRNVYRENENSADDDFLLNLSEDYDIIDAIEVEDNFSDVFRYLHTLSKDYRDITVDYYIGEMSVRDIAKKYSLAETTVKWRLNVSREKLKKRIGDNKMDKIYKRLNWCTTSCNGSLNTDKYLHSQIARAICEAAYEKPVTVEEISLKTGLPTIFIEDELPKLIYGDAIVDEGNGKYSTDFIILRMCDKALMEKNFEPMHRIVEELTDYYESLIRSNADKVKSMGFYRCEKGMDKLGYIAFAASLRNAVSKIKGSLDINSGSPPPRKDGGYGWFIVEETGDESDTLSEESTAGCNMCGNDDGKIYYFWIYKYFEHKRVYRNGTIRIASLGVMSESEDGKIPDGLINDDDLVNFMQSNLVRKTNSGYEFTFPCFTQKQFIEFRNLFRVDNERLKSFVSNLAAEVHKSFKQFVPKRLDSQINQWVSCYCNDIIYGHLLCNVAEELIKRGILETPDPEIPMTNGVFYVSGAYINDI